MNTFLQRRAPAAGALAVAAAVSIVLAGCATAPVSPAGAEEVRQKLTSLKADPNLAARAPVEIGEAEAAVRDAELPVTRDAALGEHYVYIADRKVEIAIARASTRFAEDQRARLGEERERARLEARTREADNARADADAAQLLAANTARVAMNEAGDAARRAEGLQRQIDELKARETDRGLVLTLDDVLFTSDKADLKVGATSNLNQLVTFLNQNPSRRIEVEGHTDNVGGDDYNQALSQRRAESVRSYLIQQGIASSRITASGKGERQPVTDNDSPSGRQQNRRVEVIIGNSPSVTESAVAG